MQQKLKTLAAAAAKFRVKADKRIDAADAMHRLARLCPVGNPASIRAANRCEQADKEYDLAAVILDDLVEEFR